MKPETFYGNKENKEERDLFKDLLYTSPNSSTKNLGANQSI